jgi:superfamily II DNA/RNA helicase
MFMNDFTGLGVLPEFADKLAKKSVIKPTAVQRLVIPKLLEEQNVIFRSATGTGKTLAYLLPGLQLLSVDTGVSYQGPQFLVCAPTLELCSQIKDEVDFLLEGKIGVNVSLLIGSVNLSRQIDNLKKNKPRIIVGNPGRLLLLAKMGKLKLKDLRFLVFDEADRLTAAECREETSALTQLAAAELKRRSLSSQKKIVIAACSATVSAKTRELLHPLLENAELYETDEQEILRDRISHWAIFSESRRKTQTLVSFLAAVKPKKTLVFTSRSNDAGKTASILQRRKIAAAALFSGMDKKDRREAMERFRSGKAEVLVSSDLAARGLDIPCISHVVALDVREDREAYIHRAGRTGRAGKKGVMVSIGDEIEMRRLSVLEKKLGITVYPKELYGGKAREPVQITDNSEQRKETDSIKQI